MPIALPVLLGALVHDCANPISEARAHVDDVYRQVRKVRRSLRQLSHVFHALMSVKGQLAGHGGQLLPGRPRQIHQAIANIPNYRRIDLDVPAGLQVTASPGTLETVLSGLVRNAREHAPRTTVTIIARLVPPDASPWPSSCLISVTGWRVLVMVCDTGTGIPGTLIGAGLGDDPALGLGLWLCRQIARSQGGDLWFPSQATGATVATVWPGEPSGETADSWPLEPRQFGIAVRKAREQLGLTRLQLAGMVGIADSTIRNLETGRHRCTRLIREKLVTRWPQPKQ